MIGGRRYTMLTDFAATVRNLAAARRLMEEHKAKALANAVVPGRPVRFSDAARQFLHWSKMEHREHPNTAKRHEGVKIDGEHGEPSPLSWSEEGR